MNTLQMSDLLTKIAQRVHGNPAGHVSQRYDGTSPVTLQIGFVNNICVGDGIVITDAPAAITEIVTDWVKEQNTKEGGKLVSASAGYGGLLIR